MAEVLRREFDGVVYDVFLGRSFDNLGKEHYVSVDLASGGRASYEPTDRSLYALVMEVFVAVQDERKILLDQSPRVFTSAEGSGFLLPFGIEKQCFIKDVIEGIKRGDLSKPVPRI